LVAAVAIFVNWSCRVFHHAAGFSGAAAAADWLDGGLLERRRDFFGTAGAGAARAELDSSAFIAASPSATSGGGFRGRLGDVSGRPSIGANIAPLIPFSVAIVARCTSRL